MIATITTLAPIETITSATSLEVTSLMVRRVLGMWVLLVPIWRMVPLNLSLVLLATIMESPITLALILAINLSIHRVLQVSILILAEILE